MTDSPTREILQAIEHVSAMYYRLILVVCPAGSGKTAALMAAAEHGGWQYINMSLEQSQRLLELAPRQRRAQASRLITEIIDGGNGQAVALDNTELLFAASLQLDPLKSLQLVSRRRTVIAAWNGRLHDGSLIYAEPGHPEYRRYPASDLITLDLRRDN